jgi:geranylgeranyl reductase family protein
VTYDVVISGAGPAGSFAAMQLARAGARVLLVDRATFPRDKLCGDTLNPGGMALLRAHGLADVVEQSGLPIDGMVVTSGDGVRIEGLYGAGMVGCAIRRRDLDARLLEAAVAAGAHVEERTTVVGPLLSGGRVTGLRVRGRGGDLLSLPGRVTIAADGRRSPLALALGLAHHPRWPRRWAIGAYYDGVTGLGRVGEMHVRPGCYIGVAPASGGLANVCLVTGAGPGFALPAALLDRAIARDPLLRDRFTMAARVTDVVTLGPLALDATGAGAEGLLLAGDAAGFVDPMTGDGMHLALRGGQLAAQVSLEMLEDPRLDGAARLALLRRRAFSFKLRFNRVLRTLVGSPMGVRMGAAGASLLPFVLRRVIATAGDVSLAREDAA